MLRVVRPFALRLPVFRSSMGYSTFTPAPPLSTHDLNQHTIDAEYAVRGRIAVRADELQSLIESHPTSHGLPFSKIVNANIGNPQSLDQKPLTWYRQVLSILQYPELLQYENSFPKDVVERARILLQHVGSVGAYSHSQGSPYIRGIVADFITQRDGYAAAPENIFLTSGASSSVQYLLQVLSKGPSSGFLIPIPQYPLYTAAIALNNATPLCYYLNEENHWSTNPAEIRKLVEESKAKGIDVKALVVINPGNPTGSILSKQDIIELIDIAAEHGFVLISDEVYQENIFKGKFLSMKKVLCELKEAEPETYAHVQLASLHSTSKGVSGECGQRGGYMELVGFKTDVKDIVFKLASINLCSVVSGQALMELMVNPPKPGDASYESYHTETSTIHADLEKRAAALYKAFTEMEDISCNKPMGAMYLFPRLEVTEESYHKLFTKAREQNLEPDDIYCIELLEHTGISCVPGNGFGQVEGTFHLRTTFLPPGTEWVERWAAFHKTFIKKYRS